ncbi:MAG: ribonuclease P protein component [Pseudomonadota bacterium]
MSGSTHSADNREASGEASDAGNSRFSRRYRLLAAVQYAETFAARRVLRGTQFALHYRPNGQLDARLGLVIPKKQARAAVLRNAIKRQAREIFRLHRSTLPAMDLVLRLARPVEPGMARDRRARAAWREEILALFVRLKALAGS